MKEYLKDLYRHQEWADAEHWKAFEALPASFDDPALSKRLRHIHLVQKIYLIICNLEKANVGEVVGQFEHFTTEELKRNVRIYHNDIAALLDRQSLSSLNEPLTIPWMKGPTFTMAEAYTQAALHSHYHRGQNATRLRELGGEPPMTDFIAWLWKGRPIPPWT
jgi:uncharacterized damage-inducible protein DinB